FRDPVNDQEKQRILMLRSEGKTSTEISKLTGRSYETIRRVVNAMKNQPASSPQTIDAIKAQIKQLEETQQRQIRQFEEKKQQLERQAAVIREHLALKINRWKTDWVQIRKEGQQFFLRTDDLEEVIEK